MESNERQLFSHLKNEFRDVPLETMAKIFKLSLAVFFSKETGQELPEDHLNAIDILPPSVREQYNQMFPKTEQKATGKFALKFAFLQDILMCKGIANPVPKGMILAGYQKHQKTLSTVGESPEEFLVEFRKILHKFGGVVKLQDFSKTRVPTRSGYLGVKRSEGGLLKYLLKDFDTHGYIQRSTERIDPIVTHIEGAPGIGKSFLTSRVFQKIGKAFGYKIPAYHGKNPNLSSFVYNRTIGSDHWDGYSQQLISSIDDFGCRNDRQQEDYASLIQLCSDQEFVLPMAKLVEKGMKFKSEFLFLSTNGLTYNRANGIYGIQKMACGDAVLRRVAPTWRITGVNGNLIQVSVHLFGDRDLNKSRYYPSDHVYLQFDNPQWITKEQLVDIIADDAINRYSSIHGKKFFPCTNVSADSEGYGFYFPMNPPDRLPRCQAYAIPEPCKVRLITKNEPETWILKPVQMALWESLKSFKIFDLTHGPDIDLTRLHGNGILVSGDYEAATDNFNSDIMKTAAEILAEYIPDDTLRKWFIWEAGPHEISYPEWTGLNTIIQTRGQLMGSLLSFPILCLANATTYALAIKKCFGKDVLDTLTDTRVPCFVNGDDILFVDNHPGLYNAWRETAASIGLKLSVGKCYRSKRFGLINSQMILRFTHHKDGSRPWGLVQWHSDIKKSTVRGHTSITMNSVVQLAHGKIKNYFRYNCEPQQLDFSLALTHISKSKIIKYNKHVLSKTCESLDVSKEYGGIGIKTDTYTPTHLDKLVYGFKVLRKRPKILKTLPNGLIVTRMPEFIEETIKSTSKFPNHIKNFLGDLEFDIRTPEEKFFDWRNFRKFCQWVRGVPNLRESIKGMDLYQQKPLDEIKSQLVVCHPCEFQMFENIAKNFLREVPEHEESLPENKEERFKFIQDLIAGPIGPDPNLLIGLPKSTEKISYTFVPDSNGNEHDQSG
jgi:hypothetical protein